MNAKIYLALKSFDAPKLHLRDIIGLEHRTEIEEQPLLANERESRWQVPTAEEKSASSFIQDYKEKGPLFGRSPVSLQQSIPLESRRKGEKGVQRSTQTLGHEASKMGAKGYMDIVHWVRLPKRRTLYTVLRSPHIDKKSREQFEMRVHKQLIVIQTNTMQLREQLFRLKLHNLSGVQLKVTLCYTTYLNRRVGAHL